MTSGVTSCDQAQITRPLARDTRGQDTGLGDILQAQLVDVVWGIEKFIQFVCLRNKYT